MIQTIEPKLFIKGKKWNIPELPSQPCISLVEDQTLDKKAHKQRFEECLGFSNVQRLHSNV